jgi:hypothetical protein
MRAVEMKWRGKAYTIPANKAFDAGEQVEDVVTLGEISSWGANIKTRKLSKAYGVLLRYAGAKVADVTVLEEITSTGSGLADAGQAVKALVDVILSGANQRTDDKAEPPKKTSDL